MPYEIGARLRKFRNARNLSQKDFASLIGASNSRVSNWEQGLNRPDIDTLATICRVLRISPSELLDVRLAPEDLSSQERHVIMAYRAKPHLQSAVNILLDIEQDH